MGSNAEPHRIAIIGTGAAARMHAQAYRNIGHIVAACAGRDEARGRAFAAQHGCTWYGDWQQLCRHPEVDFVDVCTLPDFRLDPVLLCAESGKPVLVEKPMAA